MMAARSRVVSIGMSIALEFRGLHKRFAVGAGLRRVGARASRRRSRAAERRMSSRSSVRAGPGKSTLLLCAAGLLSARRAATAWFGESDRAAPLSGGVPLPRRSLLGASAMCRRAARPPVDVAIEASAGASWRVDRRAVRGRRRGDRSRLRDRRRSRAWLTRRGRVLRAAESRRTRRGRASPSAVSLDVRRRSTAPSIDVAARVESRCVRPTQSADIHDASPRAPPVRDCDPSSACSIR